MQRTASRAAAFFGAQRQPSPRPTPAPPPPRRVHIAPHSHFDIGWRNTYAETASKASGTLRFAVRALLEDSRRTFVWAETPYLLRWLEEEGEAEAPVGGLTWGAAVRLLVESGQLDLVGGPVRP